MDELEGEKDAAGAKVAKLEAQVKQAEKCVLRVFCVALLSFSRF